MNVRALPSPGVKLEYHYDLLREGSAFEHIKETVDSLTLESTDIIVSTRPVGLDKRNSISRSCSLPLIDSVVNQDKQSPPIATLINSETPLSMTDWTSDEAALDSLTPISLVSSDLSLSIDPRLLDESDPQPIILPSSHELVPGPQSKS